MDWKLQWDILVSFTRATMLGYGGGPSSIPLYQIEVVDQRGWMSTEEFGNALAFGNTLPGPIATKLSAYIGYQVGGPVGALMALIGTVLPTAILMVGLYALLAKYKDSPYVKGAIKGVKPVLFVMLAQLAADFFPSAFGAGPRPWTFMPFMLAAGYFILVHYLGIHPFWGVLTALAAGAVFLR